MPAPTDHLGPYELRGELGRGAMAVVWRAFDTRLEREVALKEPVLPPGMGTDMAAQFSERFVREAKAAARLSHSGIVTVYDAEVYDGRPTIAMEIIHGEPLSVVLERGPLAPDAAAAVLDQLLDAIAYAHERGIVHRDIKPDNIFVTPDGRVKLTDFGIARLDNSSTLTQAGTVMGTPGYMAPEQITGQPVDARTDVFAVGVVGYELATGRNPFGTSDGLSMTSVMFKVVQSEVPEVHAMAPGVPALLSDVIRVAMAKDPAFRFPGADAMRQALRGGQIVVAGPGGGTVPAASMPTVPWGGPVPVAAQAAAGSQRALYVGLGVVGALIIGVLILMATSSSAPRLAASATPIAESVATAEAPDTAAPTPEQDRVALESAVEQWRGSWEAMDIGRYMANYSSQFRSAYKGYDYTAWRRWKSDVFSAYAYQRVEISGLSVDVSGDTATATFTQDFWSDSKNASNDYHDTGRKTLSYARENGAWLITGEEFVQY